VFEVLLHLPFSSKTALSTNSRSKTGKAPNYPLQDVPLEAKVKTGTIINSQEINSIELSVSEYVIT
jgi:hypothetical protein